MLAENEAQLKRNLADYGIVLGSAELVTSPIRSQTASLGCGTLVLIAIIVMIFSRGDDDELKRKLDQLRGEVRQLESAANAQTKMLKELRAEIEPTPEQYSP
jgi:hypothetical protein